MGLTRYLPLISSWIEMRSCGGSVIHIIGAWLPMDLHRLHRRLPSTIRQRLPHTGASNTPARNKPLANSNPQQKHFAKHIPLGLKATVTRYLCWQVGNLWSFRMHVNVYCTWSCGLDNIYVYGTCSCSRDKVTFDENLHTRMTVALDTHAWQIHNTSLPASKLEQNCWNGLS